HRAGAVRLHRSEVLRAPLMKNADQIDDMVGTFHGAVDRPADAKIGLHGMDLPDITERLQVTREFRTAHRGADAVSAPGQRPDDVATEKARSAEHGDEFR